VDEKTGFITGYRDTVKDELCLNYKHDSKWFCPGSMAKVAFQMLLFADELDAEARSGRIDTPPRSKYQFRWDRSRLRRSASGR
jgi:hypothetical protein